MQKSYQPNTQEKFSNRLKLPSSLPDIQDKVSCKMILLRIDDNIDTHLSKQQFGFRKNRGTVDVIFIVRQITEKANEYQIPLHFNFVDLRLHLILSGGALWKMLRSTVEDPKITSLIEAVYENIECAVVIIGQLTERFRVEIRVRLGCLLLPIRFVLGFRHGRPEEIMQVVQARYQPQL